MKTCTKCKIEKSFEKFHKSSKSKSGLKSSCKECHKAIERERFFKNNTPEYKEKKRKEANDRYWSNPDKYRITGKEQYHENKNNPGYKQARAEYQKEYRQQDREEKLKAKREDYANNREARLATQKRTAQTPEGRARRSVRDKKRRENDPLVKLGENMRSRMSTACRRYKFKKPNGFNLGIGCSWEDYVKHMESQFHDCPEDYEHLKKGEPMSWEKYGKNGWHVDEIIPVSAWDFNIPEHITACWHWTNRRPLWGPVNYENGGVRTSEDQVKFDLLIKERLEMLRETGVLQLSDHSMHLSIFK